MKGFIIFSLILLFVTGCTISPEKISCCQQCLDAASQDPAGYDISIKECYRYELSEGCINYFEQKEARVGECREVIK